MGRQKPSDSLVWILSKKLPFESFFPVFCGHSLIKTLFQAVGNFITESTFCGSIVNLMFLQVAFRQKQWFNIQNVTESLPSERRSEQMLFLFKFQVYGFCATKNLPLCTTKPSFFFWGVTMGGFCPKPVTFRGSKMQVLLLFPTMCQDASQHTQSWCKLKPWQAWSRVSKTQSGWESTVTSPK